MKMNTTPNTPLPLFHNHYHPSNYNCLAAYSLIINIYMIIARLNL